MEKHKYIEAEMNSWKEEIEFLNDMIKLCETHIGELREERLPEKFVDENIEKWEKVRKEFKDNLEKGMENLKKLEEKNE